MGRLTSTPELRYTTNDTPVISFTLAVNRSYAKQETDFIDVVAWRSTAEFIDKYFSKGQLIAIEGSIRTSIYQDKGSNIRKAVEVLANKVHFTGEKKGDNEKGIEIEADNDIPF